MRVMSPNIILSLIVLAAAAEKANDHKPVSYSFTAVVTAYFDENGLQVGYQDSGKRGAIGEVPDRFPFINDMVTTDTETYVIESILGNGTGSAVYQATPRKGIGRDVAIKFQKYSNDERSFSVETDFEVLKRTARFPGLFPRAHYLSGVGSVSSLEGVLNLRYLVMELLGSSVWTLLKFNGNRLPMKTICSMGIQSIEILETLHSVGIVHGDIHLENMLFTMSKPDESGFIFSDRIVMGDYGKSSLFLDSVSNSHIDDTLLPMKEGRNMLFLSPYELALGSPSRREDIYRLMETLARMVDERGYSSRFKPLQGNREALLHAKRTIPLEEIFPDIHPLFANLFEYSRSLGFAEKPDYSEMRAKFESILRDQGFTYRNKILLDM